VASDVVLVVGTRKGLFIFESDQARDSWRLRGPYLKGADINHATMDPRDGRLFATANDPWFGPQVQISADRGETWEPASAHPRFPEDSGKSVERLWRLEPGRPNEGGRLYCGADPGCLFSSDDGGRPGKKTSRSTRTRRATAGSPARAA
jgi:hypothetical protein